MADIVVVGGGLAGLASAIGCAERGASVELHEATGKLGGRARHLQHDGFVINRGPHALYLKGPASAWLEQRGLLPEVIAAKVSAVRFRYGGQIHRLPIGFLLACRRLQAPAPDLVSFSDWARLRVSPRAAGLVEGSLTLAMYDGQPGRHAAGSVQTVLARTLEPGVVSYVRGGWGALVDRLVDRARELGVKLHVGSRVEGVDRARITIVATGPSAAARLLDDPSLEPDGQSVVLRDLGLRFPKRRGGRGPVAVLDFDEGVYLARYTAYDPSLAPAGHDLVQCCAGLRVGEETASAHERIERVLDAAFAGWRGRAVLDRRSLTASPGARDPVGRGWEQRPAIDRDDGVLLAGDWVATPGFLSEACFTSATAAAQRALERAQAPRELARKHQT